MAKFIVLTIRFEGNIMLCRCLMSSANNGSCHTASVGSEDMLSSLEEEKHARTTARRKHRRKRSTHKDSKQEEGDKLTRPSGNDESRAQNIQP